MERRWQQGRERVKIGIKRMRIQKWFLSPRNREREKSTADERQESWNQSKEMEMKLLGCKGVVVVIRRICQSPSLPSPAQIPSLEQIKSDETSITPTDKERGSKLPPKLKEMER